MWPWSFPAEPGAEGFEGIAQGQSPSSYQVEQLHLAAMHFASFALDAPAFFTCPDWAGLPAEEQEACARTSLLQFAERAYRRPLRAGEQTRIEGFWQANIDSGPLDEAVTLTAAGILQAPAPRRRSSQRDPTHRVRLGVEFAHKLAASRRVRDCYTLHWTRYALGNHLERTTPGVKTIQERFREDDSIKELLVSIATSELFRARSVSHSPQAPGAGP